MDSINKKLEMRSFDFFLCLTANCVFGIRLNHVRLSATRLLIQQSVQTNSKKSNGRWSVTNPEHILIVRV